MVYLPFPVMGGLFLFSPPVVVIWIRDRGTWGMHCCHHVVSPGLQGMRLWEQSEKNGKTWRITSWSVTPLASKMYFQIYSAYLKGFTSQNIPYMINTRGQVSHSQFCTLCQREVSGLKKESTTSSMQLDCHRTQNCFVSISATFWEFQCDSKKLSVVYGTCLAG